MTISHRSRERAWVSLLAASVFISGCGGGGGGSSAQGQGMGPSPVPTPAPPTVNTAPVASPTDLSTPEDTVLQGSVSASDAEGNTLTFALSVLPTNGAVTMDSRTGVFVYLPNPNYFGKDVFSFTASDGTNVSQPAFVNVSISPVNDLPTFRQFQESVVGEARQMLSVTAEPVDVDGTIVRTEITQADGSAVPEFSLRADGFEFRMPDTGEVIQKSYRVRAFDADGNVLEREFSAAILPLSASGNLTTLVGSARSSGLQWVITGDGFTASQRALLLQRASNVVNAVLGRPELAKHRSAWNVQVVSATSAESGIDVPSGGLFRDTAYDAAFDCGGISRIICLNWSKVQARVIPEFADYDVLTVLVNSDLYGGSGGPDGAVVSNHKFAGDTALHEMGHTFAGFADEYVDSLAAGFSSGIYFEGKFPNITRLSDPAQIPWRHWFQDPNNIPTTPGLAGIGRFEGAYYLSSGYYRPADNSFMRTDTGAVTVVHVEAWTRSIYRKIGPIAGSAPAEAALTLAPGEERTFTVEPRFPASVQSVRWYLDGQEVESARDSTQFACCAGITGAHVLRADVDDISGAIRAPDPADCRATRSWNLDINEGTSVQPRKIAAATSEGEIIIRMRVDASGHQVEGVSRAGSPRLARNVPISAEKSDAPFRFVLTDATGQVLESGDVPDPRIVRGPLPMPGEELGGHTWIQTAEGHYVIRAHDSSAIRYLRVESRAASQTKALSSNSAQAIDLAPLLRRASEK